MNTRDRYGIWTQQQLKPLLPDWLIVLLTPFFFCLFLGVLFLAAPVGLLLRAVLSA